MLRKFLILLTFMCLCILFYPPVALACTYNASITGNHLDFAITSDQDKIILVQYKRRAGANNVTKLYSPNIGIPWNYYSDPNCANHNGQGTMACNQAGAGAYWSYEIPSGTYHLLPGGVYGLDFTSTPDYGNIGIEYAVQLGSTGESWTFCNRIGDIQQPTPTATPTPTPSPTPTPIPVTKVFFVPGFGASWNTTAFANCSFDNNPNNWSLAPYAEDVYTPILSALSTSGWDVKPYYYDWRQQIATNAYSLASTIASNTINGEKINLIGHSMGGLIGRQFLTNSNGSKLNKFLTAGSPHMGVVQTYPAWSGGDIWEDNFLIKIATTLYIKHCGGVLSNNKEIVQKYFPSISNMLPIFDYLKDIKTELLKPVFSMTEQNPWHLSNDFNAYGVDTKTISGTGFVTLKNIRIKERSRQDIKNEYWNDGKPAGKIYSVEGDGTVLTFSSNLPGVPDVVLNQSHAGLVNSIEGMTEILNFLESPSYISSSNYTEPKTALILIGESASFTVIDQMGNVRRDKNGMVAITNPKSGNYKINILPRSGNTLFVIAQFLTNGKTLYKEYNFSGFVPKFKSLNFTPENPQEDILN